MTTPTREMVDILKRKFLHSELNTLEVELLIQYITNLEQQLESAEREATRLRIVINNVSGALMDEDMAKARALVGKELRLYDHKKTKGER